MTLYLIFALTSLVAPGIEALTDLAADNSVALKSRAPIVLYVSRSDCTFCRRFEKDVLSPLLRSKRFFGEVLFRELEMDAPSAVRGSVRDRHGNLTSAKELAQALGVHVTPTVLFLDGNGRKLNRSILGYDGNEYASYYLERAISQAIIRAAEHQTDKQQN